MPIDLKHICKAIAIATDHKNIKLVTSAILDLENTQIETLWHIVEKKLQCYFFLNIMVLAQNMNLMKKSGEGGIIGGDTICGNIAMLRMKLGLSEKEIMERPWILTQIESADFPWFSSKKEKDNND